jgi:hypothetical protein
MVKGHPSGDEPSDLFLQSAQEGDNFQVSKRQSLFEGKILEARAEGIWGACSGRESMLTWIHQRLSSSGLANWAQFWLSHLQCAIN